MNVPSNQYLPAFPPSKPSPPETEFSSEASSSDQSRFKPEVPAVQPPAPAPLPTQPPRLVTSLPVKPTQPPYQPTPAPYKPSQAPYKPSPAPYQPSPAPYQPTPAPYQPTQAPYQPTQTPYKPTPPLYQPPEPEYLPQPQPPAKIQTPAPPRANIPTQRPYQQEANQPRPAIAFQDQSAQIVPAACAAAMNCTLIEYCDAIGTMSKTPVELTEFQKTYRVPMTDCMIMPSRELGKCCRNPDYTDPWPIGRSGIYNADELNAVFDSGAYKSERQTSAKRQAPARVAVNNPAVAATNQIVSRVSAPVNQQRVVPQPRPNREISPISPQATNLQQGQSQTCGVRNYVSFRLVIEEH